MESQLRKPKSMGPQPREPQTKNISLFESLGIDFFEALFVYKNSISLTLIEQMFRVKRQ